MKRIVILLILAIVLIGLVLIGSGGKDISFADSSIFDNEVANSMRRTNNSSASTTIMITMYTVDDE